MTLTLQGNSLKLINQVSIAILAGMIGVSLLGVLADYLTHRSSHKEKLRTWATALLIASYCVWIPALTTTLFSYSIGALNMLELKHSTDTQLSFAHHLATTGSMFGCIALIFFATVVPVLKIIMLILGFVFHYKGTKQSLIWSRRSILFVQTISKWAAPDMFAYILLNYLIRSLNHPPTLNGLIQLDIGFACFTAFCVASTVSSIGVRIPEVADEEYENCKARCKDCAISAMKCLASFCRGCLGENFSSAVSLVFAKRCERATMVPFVAIAIMLLFMAFALLMCIGITMPVMTLRLNIESLFKEGNIPEFFRPFVESLHLQDLASADVSIWRCSVALVDWMEHGEVTTVFAFVMLAVCCVVLPILDMIVLLTAGLLAQFSKDSLKTLKHCQGLASVLRKLAMLDVFLVGVVLTVISGKTYERNGLEFNIADGIKVLLGAEICHCLTYSIVSHTVERRLKDEDAATERKNEMDDDGEMQRSRQPSGELPSLLHARNAKLCESTAAAGSLEGSSCCNSLVNGANAGQVIGKTC